MNTRKILIILFVNVLLASWCGTYVLASNQRDDQTIDGVTCATETWLYGKFSGFEPGAGIMTNQQIQQHIAEYMGGRKDNRIVMLSSTYNNYPVATPAEYTLDPDTMTLYGIHETNTEKLLQIERNPYVSLSLHEEFNDFESQIKSVQVKGVAVIIDGSDPEFECILADILPFEEEYGKYFPDLSPEALIQLLKVATVLTKITLYEATLADTTFKASGFRPYQRWLRGVMISNFNAKAGNRKVTLTWETDTENEDLTGFNIYRSKEGSSEEKITVGPISAKGSSTKGASYEFTDNSVANRKTYTYTLVSVDKSGQETKQAQTSATPRLILWQ